MRTIMMLVLILVGSSLYAVENIEFYSFGEFSYLPTKAGMFVDQDMNWFDASIAVGIDAYFIDSIRVFTEAELVTDMSNSGSYMFTPHVQKYYVRGGIWYKYLFLQVEHLCTHSIDTRNLYFNGGHNKVTIGFDSRGSK